MLRYIKNKKLRRLIKKMFIAAIIILALIIIFLTICSFLRTSYRKLYKVGETKTFESTYNTLFNEINIDTKMTDIYIKESVDNNVKIITYGEKDYINIKEEDNKLYVDINDKNLIGIDLYSCISKIEIYLPNTYSEVIRINSNYGDIKIDNFINSSIDINNKYGDISIKEVSYIKIKNKEGNINVDSSNIVRIDSKNGDINLGVINALELSQKYGNLNIDNIEQKLELNLTSGNIKIKNMILENNSYIETKYSDIKINSIEGVYITAKTDHGKVKVKRNNKKSNIKLDIHNYNGDININ